MKVAQSRQPDRAREPSVSVKVVKRWLVAGLLAAFVGLAASPPAAALTITDDNSTVNIDPASQVGVSSWTVDGKVHLARQWFWYRAAGDTREFSIDNLPLDAAGVTDPDFDGQNEIAYIRYLVQGAFKIEVYFLLNGGNPGSAVADLAESIAITNLSRTERLEFHFFQYCDFDLCGTVLDDGLLITGGNTANQWQTGFALSETVETPKASHYEANFFNATLVSLNDNAITTLNDNAGPLGPGDLTWAFQWDMSLAPGGSFMISKDKLIVPEPGTLSLLMVGGALVLVVRRRRKAR